MRILLASISSSWMWLLWLFIALSCTTTTTTTTAFVLRSSRATTSTTRSSTALFSTTTKQESTTSTTSTPPTTSALITKEAASKSQLFNAFSALDLRDQYDAVLTGLCAKILDNNDNNTTTTTSLDDPLQLLQEMNDQKVAASPRSVMALIDCACTATTQDINVMKTVLQLCRSNVGGGTTKYGAQVVHIVPFPISPTQKVICADGISRTRRERLQRVEGIPEDHRQQEVMNAIITMSIVGACEFTNIVLPQGNAIHDTLAPEANLILFAMVVIAAIDNFYDVIQSTSKLVLNQLSNNKEKNNKNKKIAKKGILPDKDTLPLGLGQGILTGSIVRGFSRLVTVDVEREAQCEAAALYSAYVLGLPCFAFRPNAYEAKLLTTTTSNETTEDLTASHILHMLVWLLAPVAMESANHPQLIMSDPREATHYLNQVLEYYNNKTTNNNNDVLDEETQQLLQDIRNNQDDLLKWAYTEADNLLRENKRQVEAIAQRLAGGAATMGDCVAVMEGWQ